MDQITWNDFEKIELRASTITDNFLPRVRVEGEKRSPEAISARQWRAQRDPGEASAFPPLSWPGEDPAIQQARVCAPVNHMRYHLSGTQRAILPS